MNWADVRVTELPGDKDLPAHSRDQVRINPRLFIENLDSHVTAQFLIIRLIDYGMGTASQSPPINKAILGVH
jgi:hypothetical protein